METKSENVLEVKNLSVLIKERFLIKDISFSLKHGETLGIVGDDGSGKTSLIKTLTGSLPISDGSITIYGKNIELHPEVLNQVGICLDPPVFFKFQSVIDNMMYLCSLSGHNDKVKIVRTLKKFNLDTKMRKKVYSLSFYERKLMALALAFVTNPKLLILDEPFKSLPVQDIFQIRKYIAELRENGTTIIMTAKTYDSLEDQCDTYLFMANRKIFELLPRKECEKYSTTKTYAFVEVKYPHYCGKMIMEKFDYKVKLIGKKVLFEADEDATAEIVRFFTRNKLAVYSAGYINNKSERIFARLTPYFKEN